VAKDSDKGAGKGSKKIKLPKEVGGVKVPKKLRKLGNKAVEAARNPVVSEVVAGAMLAAAAALREGKDPKAAVKAGQGGADEVRKQAGRLSDSLRAMAIDLARRTLDGLEDRRGSQASEPSEGGGPVPEQGGRKGG
jgi:hypothetical protein